MTSRWLISAIVIQHLTYTVVYIIIIFMITQIKLKLYKSDTEVTAYHNISGFNVEMSQYRLG